MDDLNDLVWSSAPAQPPVQRTSSPFTSSFDLLSRTAPSSSSRPYSPSPLAAQHAQPPKPRSPAPPAASSPGADAFSSLLSFRSPSSSANTTNLSLAQRQAKLAEESRQKIEAQSKAFQTQGAFWDQLGGNGVGGGTGGRAPPSQSSATAAPPIRISSPALVPSRPASTAPVPPPTRSAPLSSQQPAQGSKSSAGTIWDEFDLLSSPQPSAATSSKPSPLPSKPLAQSASIPQPVKATNLFDFFEDDNAPRPKPAATTAETHSRSFPPLEHDFGDGEGQLKLGGDDGAGLLNEGADEEEDFMSAFNNAPRRDSSPPKQPPISLHSSKPSFPPSQPSASSSSRRPVSPPPHILGQLVEMGFSLAQARQALASTSTGLDVQIALEMLISETQSGSSAGPPAPFSSRNGAGRYDNEQEDGDEAHAFRLQREEEEAAAERHRRRRRQGPSRDGARRNEQQEAEQREAKEQEERDVASRLLERGNAIGVSLFNKAGALWGEGKMQVQKAMEERARAVAAAAAGAGEGGGGVVADGRPRWMQEAAAASEREEQEVGRGKEREKISFKDSDGEEEEEATALGVRNGAGPSSSARRLPMDQSRRQQEDSQPTASVASVGAKIGSLFSAFTADETPPPSRQQQQPAQPAQPSFTNSRRRPQQPSSSSSSTPRQATPQLPPRPVTPPPAALLVRRSLPAISPQALSLSLASREKGNAAFKLGQYPEATAHYTTALSHLPPSHLLTIPLLNNRASSLLKEGERARAIEDTSAVIELVGMGYDPRREVACDWNAFGAGTGGKGVDLGEALIKAVGKRAAASEAGERWEEAGKDWERVVQGWGGVSIGGREKAAALDGARRCRKMVGGGGESTSAAPARAPLPARPKPKPKPVALSSEPLKQSAALDALRSTAATAASDDALRLSLKDSVDARLFAWRRGKETNLRALIASLENILPPTFNWVKVGLHELVTEKQVKVRYVKAIGKVHPDKLSAAGVEERMIAGGVFGALNEAWNASQA